MKSFLTKLLPSIILILICSISVLPTVNAINTLIENNDINVSNIEEQSEYITEDNAENKGNFQVMLTNILNTTENLSINNENQKILTKSGVWIKDEDRDYILNLINLLTKKMYKIDENGFLIKESQNTSSEENEEDISNIYIEKIDKLINSEKLIIISIDDKYKSVNNIDKDIIEIKVEDDDYALLFKDDVESENCSEIVILNSNKYNKENNEETIALLMNKFLEIYYKDDSEFEKIERNNEFIDESGIYVESIQKNNRSEDKNSIGKKSNSDDILDNLKLNENETFNDEISKKEFEGISKKIYEDNINSPKNDFILNNDSRRAGIWLSRSARKEFLSFLNEHTIYTYTIDQDGYLMCDNIMKNNENLDMAEQLETEVDIEIKNILKQESLVDILLDNKYLSYNEKNDVIEVPFLDTEYLKTFSYENKKIIILNEKFYANVQYNPALSDFFIKALGNIQYKVLEGKIMFSKKALMRSDTSKIGDMLSAQTVYAGPDASNYATIGSVSSGEKIYLLGQSAGWYHIQYIVTSSGKQKSGFVPVTTVNNNGYSVHEEQMTGGQNFATETINILSCDDFDLAVSVGSVFSGEGMTVLYTYEYIDSNKSYNIAYVEISTSSKTKRGYIYSDKLSGINYPSSVARIKENNPAYSGPGSNYVRIGSASENEYVTILAKNTGNDWVFVEYNTTSGRKRGFMSYSKMSNCNHPGLYNDLPVNNGLRAAIEGMDVMGAPSEYSSKIGSISKQEVVSLYNTERGYAYIEYSTANGSKRGYVIENKLISASAPKIPNINAYSFEEGIYGKSGNGRDLSYYKLGQGKNIAFAVFGQHGWEDAWAYDGIELINIAQRVIYNLSNTGISDNWTLYIIPCANPDGVTDGYTNNGPGRCTIVNKIDMNRCWPANFRAYYTSRNYTGETPLGAIEAVQLKNFIENNIGENEKIILDIHGWLNKTYGNSELGAYFTKQFNFNHSATYGSGYLETWGKSIGAKACLLEYPLPSSSDDIVNNNYSEKTAEAIRQMLNDLGTNFEEKGEEVNEKVEVVVDGSLNVRKLPNTTANIVAKLENGSVARRIRINVAENNGYTWDKIRLENGIEGYVANKYLKIYEEDYKIENRIYTKYKKESNILASAAKEIEVGEAEYATRDLLETYKDLKRLEDIQMRLALLCDIGKPLQEADECLLNYYKRTGENIHHDNISKLIENSDVANKLVEKLRKESFNAVENMLEDGENNFTFALKEEAIAEIEKYIVTESFAELLKEYATELENLNWFLTYGKARVELVGNVERNGDNIKLTLRYSFNDYYDWDRDKTELMFKSVSQQELWYLHYSGLAKNFFQDGDYITIWEWSKGNSNMAKLKSEYCE